MEPSTHDDLLARLNQGDQTVVTELLRMEESLRRHVPGQDDAVSLIARGVRKGLSGLRDPEDPIASFVFLGPRSIDQHQLIHALAELLFGDKKAVIRLDAAQRDQGSEGQLIESHWPVNIGTPLRPSGVVLFEEIEQARPELLRLFRQILDIGRAADTNGRTIEFRNCVVLATSRIGSQRLLEYRGPRTEESRRHLFRGVREDMEREFLPEFLRRWQPVLFYADE